MKISVICPSEIAHHKFMISLIKISFFELNGVGNHSKDECSDFQRNFVCNND